MRSQPTPLAHDNDLVWLTHVEMKAPHTHPYPMSKPRQREKPASDLPTLASEKACSVVHSGYQ